MTIRGLAWDDDVTESSFIRVLKDAFHDTFKIELRIESERKGFLAAFFAESWDFAITDLVDENLEDPDPQGGVGLCRILASRVPTYLVTKHIQLVDPDRMGLPASVVIKTKSAYAGYVAWDIYEDLKRKGVRSHRDRVFVIFGRSAAAPNARKHVQAWLESKGLTTIFVDPSSTSQHIAEDVRKKLPECMACIAICTPDDKATLADVGKPVIYQPRPNVFFEMGLVLGVMTTFDRLIILQQQGQTADRSAELSSDLKGIMAIHFDGDVSTAFPHLENRLKELGVQFAST